jgi:SAM-dependent methyltransferase
VLDVGCGFGDLLSFLAPRWPAVVYTGWDLSAAHLAEARRRHPAATFVEGDALDMLRAAWQAGQAWDCVVASGTLNVRVPRWERWSWALVTAMWRVTRRTLAFNVLSNEVPHPSVVVAVDAAEWLARCRVLSPQATLRAGYLPGDATLILPRDGTC